MNNILWYNKNSNDIFKKISYISYFSLYSSIKWGVFSKLDFLVINLFNSEFLFYSEGFLYSYIFIVTNCSFPTSLNCIQFYVELLKFSYILFKN